MYKTTNPMKGYLEDIRLERVSDKEFLRSGSFPGCFVYIEFSFLLLLKYTVY